MRIVDVAPAVVMLGLSATVFLGTRELPYWTDFTPGPAFLPRWIAGAGVLLSVILLIQAWRAGGRGKPEWPDKAGAIRVGLTTAGLTLCVPLAPYRRVHCSLVFVYGGDDGGDPAAKSRSEPPNGGVHGRAPVCRLCMVAQGGPAGRAARHLNLYRESHTWKRSVCSGKVFRRR